MPLTCLKAKIRFIDKLLCAILCEHFYFPEKDSVYYYPCCYFPLEVLVLLFRRESHISFYFSVWAVIRLESSIFLGGFKVHVTYTFGAITWVYLYICIYIYIYLEILLLEILFICHTSYSV